MFFWICIWAIWCLRAVLDGLGASKNIEKPLVLCVFGAQAAFLIILSFMGIYHAFFHFCQHSNGILFFSENYFCIYHWLYHYVYGALGSIVTKMLIFHCKNVVFAFYDSGRVICWFNDIFIKNYINVCMGARGCSWPLLSARGRSWLRLPVRRRRGRGVAAISSPSWLLVPATARFLTQIYVHMHFLFVISYT